MTNPHTTLTADECQQYARHMALEGFGIEGQSILKNATVCVVGAGGLGSSCATYLALAGVGTIRICDYDVVEKSNLNRQFMHASQQVGKNKAASAAEFLRSRNPFIQIVPFAVTCTADNCDEIVGESTVVIDCVDTVSTRMVLNAYCAQRHLPFVTAGIRGVHGHVAMLRVPETPCLRCLIGEEPPQSVPVLGATAGIIGSYQALQVILLLTAVSQVSWGVLYSFTDKGEWRKLALARNESCPVCARYHMTA